MDKHFKLIEGECYVCCLGLLLCQAAKLGLTISKRQVSKMH